MPFAVFVNVVNAAARSDLNLFCYRDWHSFGSERSAPECKRTKQDQKHDDRRHADHRDYPALWKSVIHLIAGNDIVSVHRPVIIRNVTIGYAKRCAGIFNFQIVAVLIVHFLRIARIHSPFSVAVILLFMISVNTSDGMPDSV